MGNCPFCSNYVIRNDTAILVNKSPPPVKNDDNLNSNTKQTPFKNTSKDNLNKQHLFQGSLVDHVHTGCVNESINSSNIKNSQILGKNNINSKKYIESLKKNKKDNLTGINNSPNNNSNKFINNNLINNKINININNNINNINNNSNVNTTEEYSAKHLNKKIESANCINTMKRFVNIGDFKDMRKINTASDNNISNTNLGSSTNKNENYLYKIDSIKYGIIDEVEEECSQGKSEFINKLDIIDSKDIKKDDCFNELKYSNAVELEGSKFHNTENSNSKHKASKKRKINAINELSNFNPANSVNSNVKTIKQKSPDFNNNYNYSLNQRKHYQSPKTSYDSRLALGQFNKNNNNEGNFININYNNNNYYTNLKLINLRPSVDKNLCSSEMIFNLKDDVSSRFGSRKFFNCSIPDKAKYKNINRETPKNDGELVIPTFEIAGIGLKNDLFLPEFQLNEGSSYYHNSQFKDPREEPYDLERKKYPKIYDGEISYEGEWKNGMRDGFGVLALGNQIMFTGQFENNKAEGFGKIKYQDGNVFMGIWHDSQINGLGIYKMTNGGLFMGNWVGDRQSGFGNEVWPRGSSFVGEFIDGDKEPYGILNFEDNAIYTGEFKEGIIYGLGMFIFEDYRIYRGQWKYNKMHGFGEIIWPKGSWFKGQFYENRKEGFGVFCLDLSGKKGNEPEITNKNKSKKVLLQKTTSDTLKFYLGKWKNNLLCGKVIIVNKTKIQKQRWENGKAMEELPDDTVTGYENYANFILEKLKKNCIDVDDFD